MAKIIILAVVLSTILANTRVYYKDYIEYVSQYQNFQSSAKCSSLNSGSECGSFKAKDGGDTKCMNVWANLDKTFSQYKACFPTNYCD